MLRGGRRLRPSSDVVVGARRNVPLLPRLDTGSAHRWHARRCLHLRVFLLLASRVTAYREMEGASYAHGLPFMARVGGCRLKSAVASCAATPRPPNVRHPAPGLRCRCVCAGVLRRIKGRHASSRLRARSPPRQGMRYSFAGHVRHAAMMTMPTRPAAQEYVAIRPYAHPSALPSYGSRFCWRWLYAAGSRLPARPSHCPAQAQSPQAGLPPQTGSTALLCHCYSARTLQCPCHVARGSGMVNVEIDGERPEDVTRGQGGGVWVKVVQGEVGRSRVLYARMFAAVSPALVEVTRPRAFFAEREAGDGEKQVSVERMAKGGEKADRVGAVETGGRRGCDGVTHGNRIAMVAKERIQAKWCRECRQAGEGGRRAARTEPPTTVRVVRINVAARRARVITATRYRHMPLRTSNARSVCCCRATATSASRSPAQRFMPCVCCYRTSPFRPERRRQSIFQRRERAPKVGTRSPGCYREGHRRF